MTDLPVLDLVRRIAAELDARIGGVLSDRALGQLHRAIAELRAALARAGSPDERG